jgi:hypothetical protein
VKTVSVAFAVLLAISVAGCGGDGDQDGVSTGAIQVTKVDVQLQEQNFSGEAGTATLTAAAGKTRVVIVLPSFAANAQPAHIHKGTCASLNSTPAYPLENIVQGRSTTVVDVPLKTLLKGKYAINVHRSAKKLKVYVACGDISEHAAPAETVTTSDED